MIGLGKGELRIIDYCAEWGRFFEEEASRIRGAVGEHILDIQHIGSTAIPGMVAKPIIDVMAAVTSFEAARPCVPLLEAIGYVYRGEGGISRRHYFVRGEPRMYHLSLFEAGSWDWQRHLRFRDRLRADDKLAKEYAELKMRLCAEHAENREAYQKAKVPFIERVQGAPA